MSKRGLTTELIKRIKSKPEPGMSGPGMVKDNMPGIGPDGLDEAGGRAVAVSDTTAIRRMTKAKTAMKFKISGYIESRRIRNSPGDARLGGGHGKDTKATDMGGGAWSMGRSGYPDKVGMTGV